VLLYCSSYCYVVVQANQHLDWNWFRLRLLEWTRTTDTGLSGEMPVHNGRIAAAISSRGEAVEASGTQSEADAAAAAPATALDQARGADDATVRPAVAKCSTATAAGEVGQEDGQRRSGRTRRPVTPFR